MSANHRLRTAVLHSGGRCSFEMEHWANSAKVTDMHEARAGKMSEVIAEFKVLVKNYT